MLFRLDPLKFQIALDKARANLGQTVLNLDSLKTDYVHAQRQAAAAQAMVEADQATYDRYAALVKERAVAEQLYDDAKYKLASDQAALGANNAQEKAALVLDGEAVLHGRNARHCVGLTAGLSSTAIYNSRFVEMDVRFHEAAAYETTLGIVFFGSGRQLWVNCDDLAASNADIDRCRVRRACEVVRCG